MVINNNNSQINAFNKGMNSDTAFDQIENSQYVFGKNVRITRNQNIGKSNEPISSHEGIVAPVSFGEKVKFEHAFEGVIIYTGSIDSTAVVITKVNDGYYQSMYIYRFYIKEGSDTHTITDSVADFTILYRCQNVWKTGEDPDQISAVIYKELDNVVKLYVATGKHPIACFRIDGDSDSLHNTDVQIDDYINNRIIPTERVSIEGVIQGRLLTSQVQYTYRLYNKYGNTTQLAPLTNKIQVIDSSRSKEIGNAENTETSIGFTISIDTSNYSQFERLQVYRLQYVTPGSNADVHLIYDGKAKKDGSSKFVLNDVGIEPLQELTMEEFAAMSGMILIPECIEQNQEYMFCANIKDDTIIMGAGPDNSGSIEQVVTDVVLSETVDGQIPKLPASKFTDLNTQIQTLSGDPVGNISTYLYDLNINSDNVISSYNDIFTSSLLRSLRRGEEYKYAIVYYDKYGRRTDVKEIATIEVVDIQESKPFTIEDGKLIAHPIGIKIDIPQPVYENGELVNDIIGCQIVRRSSADIYQNTLLQVALARPINQALLDVEFTEEQLEESGYNGLKKSPYYPSGLLTTNNIIIKPSYYTKHITSSFRDYLYASTNDSKRLFQIFSSEIDFRRDDVLSRLSSSELQIEEQLYVSSKYKKYLNNIQYTDILFQSTIHTLYPDQLLEHQPILWDNSYIIINRDNVEKITRDKKPQEQWVFNFFNTTELSDFGRHNIKQIKDIKIADAYSGFSNYVTEDSKVKSAIKKYRNYTTSIDSFTYNNWVSFGKYDLRAGGDSEANMRDDVEEAEFVDRDGYNYWLTHGYQDFGEGYDLQYNARNGYIGPGSSCFIIALEDSVSRFMQNSEDFYTSICNITHNKQQQDLQSEEFEQYYGFGNYFKLRKYHDAQLNKDRYCFDDGTSHIRPYVIVFDGDIYITPHEFTTLFKAYDFNSYDSLQSTQITNYIPLESKVNTYFDYGMNLLNTGSENLLYEPGSIDGVTTQDRPLHQYNMIYSDNDASNDVFTLITTDSSETNNFKQRAYYSDLKTNGEFIDNFLIFKPASFIDVDSKYGEITNLMTDRNNLYYWQDTAFGKFSVNERSLVNDQNGNTIMLGQAGILSRYDYLSTKFGMRPQDFCATSAENGVFWIDITNKAVVGYTGQQVVNYGEQVNVQNIINEYICSDKNTYNRPKIDYDVQNSELLCKFLNDDNQLIFNLKYNLATSIYTRRYRDIIYIKNAMFGIAYNVPRTLLKYNYIQNETNYLSPLELQFVVNPMASVVKVYDSQQLVPIKRNKYNHRETGYNVYDYINDKVDSYTNVASHILDNTTMHFETDLTGSNESVKASTDREGNIIYNIPRFVERNNLFGNRIRGKWMKVDIVKDNPDEYFTISHVLTKFRQSYS